MRLLRALLIFALVASAVAVFVASAKTGATALSPGVVKIQYWEKWTGQEARQMQRIVDQFNATVGKAKNIYVEYTSLSQVDQKTLVATAAGVPPDVAGLWQGQLVQFSEMNALEPLDDMAKAHGITPDYYKPIYWKACNYRAHLWGLISTPAVVLLHYNKEIFEQRATDLRAAGLDPDRAPQTLAELDRYADVLTTYENVNGKKHVKTFGLLPLEPGWYVAMLPYWFGGPTFDAKTSQILLTAPQTLEAFDWIASYSRKYGKDSISEFRSGLGNFNSPQNGFLIGTVVMEQQGPWMANYIEDLAPRMNHWRIPPEKLAREKNFAKLQMGMTLDEVIQIMGAPTPGQSAAPPRAVTYDTGIKRVTLTFTGDQLASKSMTYLPAEERRKHTQWAAAPYPSSDPKVHLTGYADFDVLVIPRGSKHKEEAFEFIAFVNRQDVMESLCAMHCKNSPLAKVSQDFIDYHPNPYIQVFEDCANSPDAFATPQIAIWSELADELNVVSQKCYLLEQSASDALAEAQKRCDEKWAYFQRVQSARLARAER